MHISYSRFSSYLNCPYGHYLHYVEKLKRKRPSRPLSFGSDFHKLLQFRGDPKALKKAKVEIGDTYYAMPASWQTDLGDDYVQDLSVIFSDYQEIYKEHPVPKITEEPFEIPLGKFKGEPVNFVGVIDELYLLKKGGEKFIKIGEHKTFSRKPDMDVLVLNTQKCLYSKATQILRGIFPRAVIWDYIKSTPAKSPVWLEKSGRFSDAKSKDITPFSWLRACQERGITDPDVISKSKNYQDNLDEFFFRVEMDMYPGMVENVWEGFLYTCKQIAKYGETNKTKKLSRDCSWCDYRDICHAELTGCNRNSVIDRDYTCEEKEVQETTEEKD